MKGFGRTVIYGLSNEFGQILYIGKSRVPIRRYREHLKLGHPFTVAGLALLEIVPDGGNANVAERKWIKFFGRDNLFNRTNGGNGAWATPMADETRSKLSRIMKIQRRENPSYLRPTTPEYRQRLSDVHKGKTLSPEARQKVSAFNKGKRLSDKTKNLIRMAALRQHANPEMSSRHINAVKQKWTDRAYRERQANAWVRRKELMLCMDSAG